MIRTTYEQIVNVENIGKCSSIDMNAIFDMADKERIKTFNRRTPKRLLLCIDVQKDFMEGGSLAVPGSIQDVERITHFIYNNMREISCIMCSLDTHMPQQIFHPCWWENSVKKHPEPYTIITYEDVVHGTWHPVMGNEEYSVTYLKELKKTGKKLCIWPYHCLSGTEGATLENEFAKMVYFHSVAHDRKTYMIQKGMDPYSEMYGIIKPEYSRNNFINTQVLQAIRRFDEIYVVGEAASHCVLESVKQIIECYEGNPEITKKITVLKDCTSSIPGYETETEQTFQNLKELYGIKLERSTDIIF